MFNVVVVLECPSVDATVVISVPLLISKLAFRCLKLCNETSGKSFFSAVRLYQFENVEEFIGEIMQGDVEKAKYLQKVCGLSLTADTSNETCWLLFGASTRNGKSTLVETLAHVFGDYATAALPESLALRKNKDTRNASGDIARLDGARLVAMSEPPRRMLFDVA